MKKSLFILILSFSILGYSQFSLPADSPRQTVEQQFSISKISIDYGRPGVKGRKIFGNLVPFSKIWRAGANSCTKITFKQSINFGGKIITAGTYGLFVIPTEKDWKVILNKDFQQWGAFDFDEKLNVLEIIVPVEKLAEKQEWFEITLNPIDNNAVDLVFKWDFTKITVPLKTGNPETVNKILEKLADIKQIEKDSANKK